MIEKDNLRAIGAFRRPHGIHGEITAWIGAEMFDPDRTPYIICDVDGIFVPFFIDQIRTKGKETFLFQLQGVVNETEATAFNHKEIYITSEMISEEESFFSWSDLEGYTLSDENDTKIGTICSVDESTLNTLLEVETADGLSVLLPVSEEIVVSLDQQGQTISVEIPEGLLAL